MGHTGSLTTAVGTFGLPLDAPAQVAAVCGTFFLIAALWPRKARLGETPVAAAESARRSAAGRTSMALSLGSFRLSRQHLWLALVGLGAAALSAGYVSYYLRGGPRIIDATSYYLQARLLAFGDLSFVAPDPSAAFRGRFLLNPEASLGGPSVRLGGVFPPGYPLLLALGFRLGVPLWVGPALALALVFATHRLALRVFDDAHIARVAACLSAGCATLRYHTADTMSHAWSALLLVVALCAALEAGAGKKVLAGLSLGILCATRPVTGAVALLFYLIVDRRPRHWLLLLPALLPGLTLYLLHNQATTGSLWTPSHLRYYALADGPPGCFDYGFSAVSGCLNEHGDFVARYLPHGYGVREAIATTGRRLTMHLRDAANSELGLLALVGLFVPAPGRRQASYLLLAVLVFMLAYAPFYFDGNYPGGGARIFADVLPLEQLVLAFVLVQLKLSRFTPALLLLGFAFHTGFDHVNLRDRDGGRPLFEGEVVRGELERAALRRALVFVDSDHGFNLGFEPTAYAASARGDEPRLFIAREHGDAHDRELWLALGKPTAFHYRFEPFASGRKSWLEPYVVDRLVEEAYELAAEWPPLQVSGGFARRANNSCGAARGLELLPTTADTKVLDPAQQPVTVVFEVPDRRFNFAAEASTRNTTLELIVSADHPVELTLAWHTDSLHWTPQSRQFSLAPGCNTVEYWAAVQTLVPSLPQKPSAPGRLAVSSNSRVTLERVRWR